MRPFHAAEVYIVERSGRVAKTHSGVRAEFSPLAKDDPLIEPGMTAFLPQAYRYKEISDYSIDPGAVITIAHANSAMIAAQEFLECVAAALA